MNDLIPEKAKIENKTWEAVCDMPTKGQIKPKADLHAVDSPQK